MCHQPSALTVHMPIHKALLSCLLCFIVKSSLCTCKIRAASWMVLQKAQCVFQLKSVSRAGNGRCLSLKAQLKQTATHPLKTATLPSTGTTATAEGPSLWVPSHLDIGC